MGPRSADRGNGRGCVGARGILQLQWGRDQLIAEMECECEEDPEDVEASMGPRSADRGNALGRRAHNRWSHFASMGPRSADRGNAGSWNGVTRNARGFNGAAIS